MNKTNTDKSFRAAYLINRYLHGSLTEPENEELETWLNSSEQSRQLFEDLRSAEAVEAQLQQFKNTDSEEGWQRMLHKIRLRNNSQQTKKNRQIWWRSVAALLVLSIIAWQVLNYVVKKTEDKVILTSQYGDDVLPGTKTAELILSDGTTVSLENITDSSFTEKGSSVLRTANGSLIYLNRVLNNETGWNTIRTPNGGEYMVVLEDKTKVWLNAASSLRYPVQFTGSERRVELLEGEAYFEVAKNKEKPFIVIANRMEIQATGTAFDVNIYVNVDSIVSTTLTEGGVKVVAGRDTRLLLPGEQLRTDGATAQVIKADVEAATSWKNGLFIFNGAPLPEVMDQVARWYDVRIEYRKDFKEQKFFTGEIKRNVPVSKLLQMMELTGIAQFSIINGTIMVLPYTL
ncbi:FecR domain-containing protein [Agriterribacter sp.]|uniref:FecR domain-containing protein n=1 Tax=Agriterribacter sp. TaxID=2821509 RepID=UPI002BDAC5BF|nr:FecR domain-containing protein [Agriterribacter sp.]HTN05988.1 FecR domain-containing protein [Agriterribacter sp.]